MSVKRAALKKINRKLVKLIPLLASDKPGEVFNTAQVMARLLSSIKLDFHDLVTFVMEEKSSQADQRSPLERYRNVCIIWGRARASFSTLAREQRSQMSSSRDVAPLHGRLPHVTEVGVRSRMRT
jgi:hypothetical protein